LLRSTPNKNVLGGLGGGLGQVKGTIGVKYQPPKGKDGMYQMSITAQNETKGKVQFFPRHFIEFSC